MNDRAAICRSNCDFLLRHALDRQARDPGELEALQDIARAHRRLAIVSLLADADINAFATRLARAAQAYMTMLALPRADDDAGILCTSQADGYFDALACGALELAKNIAQRAAQHHHPEVEYEDDFLRYRTLMALLLDEAAVAPLLARWGEVLQGGGDVFLPVVQALLQRDHELFEQAFDALIERRAEVLAEWRLLPSHDRDIDATEGKLFIEALGILRLAELRAVTTRRDYRFVPDIARIPLGGLTPVAEDAWRTP